MNKKNTKCSILRKMVDTRCCVVIKFQCLKVEGQEPACFWGKWRNLRRNCLTPANLTLKERKYDNTS